MWTALCQTFGRSAARDARIAAAAQIPSGTRSRSEPDLEAGAAGSVAYSGENPARALDPDLQPPSKRRKVAGQGHRLGNESERYDLSRASEEGDAEEGDEGEDPADIVEPALEHSINCPLCLGSGVVDVPLFGFAEEEAPAEGGGESSTGRPRQDTTSRTGPDVRRVVVDGIRTAIAGIRVMMEGIDAGGASAQRALALATSFLALGDTTGDTTVLDADTLTDGGSVDPPYVSGSTVQDAATLTDGSGYFACPACVPSHAGHVVIDRRCRSVQVVPGDCPYCSVEAGGPPDQSGEDSVPALYTRLMAEYERNQPMLVFDGEVHFIIM